MLARLILLIAFTVAGCGTSNGFPNENLCAEGRCTPCVSSADCHVTVDCCGERNYCSHRQEGVPTCRMYCPELDDPPPVRCEKSRCECR